MQSWNEAVIIGQDWDSNAPCCMRTVDGWPPYHVARLPPPAPGPPRDRWCTIDALASCLEESFRKPVVVVAATAEQTRRIRFQGR